MKPLKIVINTLFLMGILNAQNPEVSSEDFSSRQVHLDFHTSWVQNAKQIPAEILAL